MEAKNTIKENVDSAAKAEYCALQQMLHRNKWALSKFLNLTEPEV